MLWISFLCVLYFLLGKVLLTSVNNFKLLIESQVVKAVCIKMLSFFQRAGTS